MTVASTWRSPLSTDLAARAVWASWAVVAAAAAAPGSSSTQASVASP